MPEASTRWPGAIVHLATTSWQRRWVCDRISEWQRSAEKCWTCALVDFCCRLAKGLVVLSESAANLLWKKLHWLRWCPSEKSVLGGGDWISANELINCSWWKRAWLKVLHLLWLFFIKTDIETLIEQTNMWVPWGRFHEIMFFFWEFMENETNSLPFFLVFTLSNNMFTSVMPSCSQRRWGSAGCWMELRQRRRPRSVCRRMKWRPNSWSRSSSGQHLKTFACPICETQSRVLFYSWLHRS